MVSDELEVESFSYLWRERKNNFALLKVEGTDRTNVDGCLIYDLPEHSKLIIEDDRTAQLVMEKMRDAGVPVVFPSELPSGENALEKLINGMLEAGKTAFEINAVIKAFENR